MRHPREARDHYAEGHSASEENPGGLGWVGIKGIPPRNTREGSLYGNAGKRSTKHAGQKKDARNDLELDHALAFRAHIEIFLSIYANRAELVGGKVHFLKSMPLIKVGEVGSSRISLSIKGRSHRVA